MLAHVDDFLAILGSQRAASKMAFRSSVFRRRRKRKSGQLVEQSRYGSYHVK
jgi:hypothetical protein